ncbi:MAG: homoserine O-succinyltransferase [Clostridia bacterium]|nr:homoserine O-succinyltransferase [Clostridia bacterium]
MPIVIPKEIPAYNVLTQENIFVMPKKRAEMQDIRPIEIAIVNLMPTKVVTETQLMRLLGNSPLQVNITLIKTESYKGTNTAQTHMDKFYKSYQEIKDKYFDGMIITGAPVETLEYEDVKYWDELCEIMEFADRKVTSTIFICWGAQAALKYYFGIPKYELQSKLFGVYKNRAVVSYDLLLKGMNDRFSIPHSRYTTIDEGEVYKNEKLQVLAVGDECGISIAKSVDNRKFFFFGHSEYDRETLKNEYLRDLAKGMDVKKPANYFINEDIDNINMSWNSTGNLLFYNWLNYYVYQVTPYEFRQ